MNARLFFLLTVLPAAAGLGLTAVGGEIAGSVTVAGSRDGLLIEVGCH